MIVCWYNKLANIDVLFKCLGFSEGENTCQGIKRNCPTCGSAFYRLSFNGEGETDVYCDMDVDQGNFALNFFSFFFDNYTIIF